MSVAVRSASGDFDGVAVTDDPTMLRAFVDPGCAAAIWRRPVPSKINAWLSSQNPDDLPRGRITIHADAVADAVGALFASSGLPDSAEKDWLRADIINLAQLFQGLIQCRYLRMRVDVITTNACRKFHVDAITARLVCTYRGAGTQYGVASNSGAPNRVFTVPTGAPILLRGTLWPAGPDQTLLHRSPPIEGTGETRLVLVLDPLDAPEEDL